MINLLTYTWKKKANTQRLNLKHELFANMNVKRFVGGIEFSDEKTFSLRNSFFKKIFSLKQLINLNNF